MGWSFPSACRNAQLTIPQFFSDLYHKFRHIFLKFYLLVCLKEQILFLHFEQPKHHSRKWNLYLNNLNAKKYHYDYLSSWSLGKTRLLVYRHLSDKPIRLYHQCVESKNSSIQLSAALFSLRIKINRIQYFSFSNQIFFIQFPPWQYHIPHSFFSTDHLYSSVILLCE